LKSTREHRRRKDRSLEADGVKRSVARPGSEPGTDEEPDGPRGLCYGTRALVENRRDRCRLQDYAEGGKDERLGPPSDVRNSWQEGTLQRIASHRARI
jgi:hypothetical protein